MMIVVVMLSSAADMKKVMIASSHISLRLLRVVMWSVMTLEAAVDPRWSWPRSTFNFWCIINNNFHNTFIHLAHHN